MWSVSASEDYYVCVNAIDCTGKKIPKDLLLARGEADASMYICSEEIRQSQYKFFV